MTNSLLDTTNQIAQNVKFEIGKEAADKLPFITAANNEADSYQSNFAGLLTRTMGFVMAIAALMVLLYLIWGALEWITSSGDKGKLENARNKITQSLIGIIVLSATTALFMLIQQFLGIKVIDFGFNSPGQRTCESPSYCTDLRTCINLDVGNPHNGPAWGCSENQVCCEPRR